MTVNRLQFLYARKIIVACYGCLKEKGGRICKKDYYLALLLNCFCVSDRGPPPSHINGGVQDISVQLSSRLNVTSRETFPRGLGPDGRFLR